MDIIIADATGKELRYLLFTSYDFEVGRQDNSFRVVIKRQEYEKLPEKGMIYIPGTEYGGLYRELSTDTKQDVICPGGLTWRGMLQKKIIQPPAGQNYATDSGELNSIIKARVEAAFPGLFTGSDESTGQTVTYRYNRYCTLEDGLTKMLKSVGYRMEIQYSQPLKKVVVSAVPIVDYSQSIEFSSDMELNYTMTMQKDGVNHLICLGQGELKDRTVKHLYVGKNGNITNKQYYFGVDEIAEVFDYAGAEEPDLIESGTDRLLSVMNHDTFGITVNPRMEISIGDIVGGRDYLSGMKMAAPVAGKVARWSDGFLTIEYKLEDDISVEYMEEES